VKHRAAGSERSSNRQAVEIKLTELSEAVEAGAMAGLHD